MLEITPQGFKSILALAPAKRIAELKKEYGASSEDELAVKMRNKAAIESVIAHKETEAKIASGEIEVKALDRTALPQEVQDEIERITKL